MIDLALPKNFLSPPRANASTPVDADSRPPGERNARHEVSAPTGEPVLTLAEQTQLHVRVIALENLVIALLATSSDHQLDCAREMATYILPRAGATPHALTTHAAAEMLSIVQRAIHFRDTVQK